MQLTMQEQNDLAYEIFMANRNAKLKKYTLNTISAFNLPDTPYNITYVPYFRGVNTAIKKNSTGKIPVRLEFAKMFPHPVAYYLTNFEGNILLTKQEAGKLITDRLNDISTELAKCDPGALNYINQIKFKTSKNDPCLPKVVVMHMDNDSNQGATCIFLQYKIKSLTINITNHYSGHKISDLRITENDLELQNANYIFLASGKIEHITFKNGKAMPYHFSPKTNIPLDFVDSTDNIIGKIPVLKNLQYFWKDHQDYYVIAQPNKMHMVTYYTVKTMFGIDPARNRTLTYSLQPNAIENGIPYSKIWQYKDLTPEKILEKIYPNLRPLLKHYKLTDFSVPELGQFSGLAEKVTNKELLKVIDWYTGFDNAGKIDQSWTRKLIDLRVNGNNRPTDLNHAPWSFKPPLTTGTQLYELFLYTKFGYGSSTDSVYTHLTSMDFSSNVANYLEMYKTVTGKKIEINYDSPETFMNEVAYITRLYREKHPNVNKRYKLNKQLPKHKRWNELLNSVKNDPDIQVIKTSTQALSKQVEYSLSNYNVQNTLTGKYLMLEYKYNNHTYLAIVSYYLDLGSMPVYNIENFIEFGSANKSSNDFEFAESKLSQIINKDLNNIY